MIGHLGPRVSALLDGQLTPADAEAAWEHVYTCHVCRDLVEREGWVKTRLARLSGDDGAVPADLKGSLLSLTPGEQFLVRSSTGGNRRSIGIAMLGGGAIGAAMVGVLAFGLGPATAPVSDRRPPASRVETPTAAPTSATTPAPAFVGRQTSTARPAQSSASGAARLPLPW